MWEWFVSAKSRENPIYGTMLRARARARELTVKFTESDF
jgi:hypothetical protein